VIGPIAIEDVRPSTPGGSHPAKAVIGEQVVVSADIFKDGHDVLFAQVRYRNAGSRTWKSSVMREVDNRRWEGLIVPNFLGPSEFQVQAWTDPFLTWRHDVLAKHKAGQDIGVELEEGALLIGSTMTSAKGKVLPGLEEAVATLRDGSLSFDERLSAIDAPAVEDLFGSSPNRHDTSSSPLMPLWVDRPRALFGSWYELFPRSLGGFRGTIDHLPAIADMGFHVLYLPPIHPIGVTDRKGRNNTTTPAPDDPGSPWAIGSKEGGHTAIDPGLGTFADFDDLVAKAEGQGLEIALDYALQCSPDHPWVKEHPEWFHRRPDGSVKFAENPPKKYQDIYPINFWPPEPARQQLWDACKQIFDFWIGHGVRIFRVDNPHTKPLAFWEWIIGGVRAQHPDVIFLAEAFTHPKMMAKLGEIGFSQSYTYFTWRVTKQELTDYAMELAHGRASDYMRPNLWPNTPDILSGPLRRGGPAVFKLRLVLAATMSPSFGIYSGYELFENQPARETDEEYLNSEKYEIKERDWSAPGNLRPYIAAINLIRRIHPSLQELKNITFHYVDNPQLIVYSKATRDLTDVILVVTNLDGAYAQSGFLGLDLKKLGIDPARSYVANDLLTGAKYEWKGSNPWVKLDPARETAHIFYLTQAPAAPTPEEEPAQVIDPAPPV